MNGYFIAAIAMLMLGVGFYLGGLRGDDKLANYKTAAEAQHAAQLKAVADDYQTQLADAQARALTQQGIIDDLHKQLATPDPSVAGLIQRMHDAEATAASARGCKVPGAGTSAGGTQSGAGIPRGDSEGERLLQDALDAASRDSKRFSAAIKLLP